MFKRSLLPYIMVVEANIAFLPFLWTESRSIIVKNGIDQSVIFALTFMFQLLSCFCQIVCNKPFYYKVESEEWRFAGGRRTVEISFNFFR